VFVTNTHIFQGVGDLKIKLYQIFELISGISLVHVMYFQCHYIIYYHQVSLWRNDIKTPYGKFAYLPIFLKISLNHPSKMTLPKKCNCYSDFFSKSDNI